MTNDTNDVTIVRFFEIQDLSFVFWRQNAMDWLNELQIKVQYDHCRRQIVTQDTYIIQYCNIHVIYAVIRDNKQLIS